MEASKEEVKSTKNNECFIIMPISDPNDYDKGHFKRIYEDIFKPACLDVGLEPIRSDDIAETSLIHIDILQKLLNSKMAICDLSSHNPNVLFELGIRQAFDMPTVLVQEKGTKPIFDISPLKYCEYRKNLIYREVLEDQKQLSKFLKDTQTSLDEGKIFNSIVQLIGIKKATLKNATDDTSFVFDYIMSEMSQLKSEVRKMNIPTIPPNDISGYYGKIIASLKQLGDMVHSGVTKSIFSKNYNELKVQITAINDVDVKNMLLSNLEEIKAQSDILFT